MHPVDRAPRPRPLARNVAAAAYDDTVARLTSAKCRIAPISLDAYTGSDASLRIWREPQRSSLFCPYRSMTIALLAQQIICKCVMLAFHS